MILLVLKFFIPIFFIIIFHEFAHLIVSKLSNVGVEIFSIGFGKRLCGFKYHGTDYRISLLPFGGYCKLEEEIGLSVSQSAFTNKRYMLKLSISIAGCFINILTGFIALFMANWFPCLFVFAQLSIWLGILNLIPIPALDGSYPLLFLLEKLSGKKRGLELMEIAIKYGFAILMILQIYMLFLILFFWPMVKILLENY